MTQEQIEAKRKKAKVVISFGKVPNHLIDVVWPKIIPHLLRGDDHWRMFYSLEEIRLYLLSGQQQLWIARKGPDIIGIVITQLDRYPQTCLLRFSYLGGKGFEPKTMLPWIRKMELWGIQNGATGVDFLGRPAYVRLMGKLGYQEVGRVYRKQLVNENNISGRLQ